MALPSVSWKATPIGVAIIIAGSFLSAIVKQLAFRSSWGNGYDTSHGYKTLRCAHIGAARGKRAPWPRTNFVCRGACRKVRCDQTGIRRFGLHAARYKEHTVDCGHLIRVSLLVHSFCAILILAME